MKFLLNIFAILFSSVTVFCQVTNVTVSGSIKAKTSNAPLPYVNVIIKTTSDSAFVSGTVTNQSGRYSLSGITPGNYVLETSYVGYIPAESPIVVGKLSEFLDLGEIAIEENITRLQEVTIMGKQDAVSESMDKKIFSISENISQGGGSLLQVMQNLPGVTVSEEGTLKIRGSDKVTVLIDGKQTALTGFGNQRALDNIPASAIDRVEVINNPSSKYDANGNAGIINIIYKKEVKEGLNGKVGLMAGLGALWRKRRIIRPSVRNTRTRRKLIHRSP